MDVKDVKSNRWVQHIKNFASENGMSYRQAMRDEGCKTAYKSPEPTPEPTPEVVSKKKKKSEPEPEPEADPMPMPILVRSEPETIPAVVKKVRVKRTPRMIPS